MLTKRSTMEPRLLYESPFAELNSSGMAGLSDDKRTANVIHILDDINRRAAA